MGYPPGFLASSASRVVAPEGREAFGGSDLARTWIGGWRMRWSRLIALLTKCWRVRQNILPADTPSRGERC